jgi:hypothetical protein
MALEQAGEGGFIAIRGVALQEVVIRHVPALSRTEDMENVPDGRFELNSCHSITFSESSVIFYINSGATPSDRYSNSKKVSCV